MTKEEFTYLFSQNPKTFEEIKHPLKEQYKRRDLCAFVLLDQLVPPKGSRPMVDSAEHDRIFLDANLDQLATIATKEDIEFLSACGVFEEYGDLCMYV